ncbi:LacI family DNA-binding transcriptional regulator [Nonomuraea endophytica]|uniref:LacI family DNA-binding transcriptional regulator n=1 Tax=Nonomuraea endophytica TaxID=714136 RepID=UPI0037CA055A
MARITITDVARVAGVSKPTVSRVLNNHADVSAETRRRVMEAIEALGYIPSSKARSLSTGRHGTVGLLMRLNGWWGFTDVQYGIADEVERRGWHLLVHPLQPGAEAERDFVARILPGLPIDGLILLMPEGMLAEISASGMPVAVIDDRGQRPGLPYVESTNREGARTAVQHLIEHGRKRIAFVTGQQGDAFAKQRYEGYLDALREAGLPADPSLVLRSDAFELHPSDISTLLPAEPDAIFAGWDEIAYATLNTLHAAGRKVPDDVAVIGYDDSPIARVMFPPLTSVRQPFRRMGRAAVRMLLDSLDHGAPVANASVPTSLVVRSSCGPHA